MSRAVSAKTKTVFRSKKGSTLSEFGPALFLMLIFGLLPIIDAIFVGIDYASARYLNELQLREAQKLPRSAAIATGGPIMVTIPAQWQDSMLGGLANGVQPTSARARNSNNLQPDDVQPVYTQIDYTPVPWQPVGSNQKINFWFVTINTTVSFRPFLTIPFFKLVPGLGAPITFSVSGRRPIENNRFLNE